MSLPYGFVITRDHLERADLRRLGPAATALSVDEIMTHGVPFRLLDDDRNLCFEGVYRGPDNEAMFSPIDDFGEYVAGCTIIQYADDTTPGAWTDL